MTLTLHNTATTPDGWTLPAGATVWLISSDGSTVRFRDCLGREGELPVDCFKEYT